MWRYLPTNRVSLLQQVMGSMLLMCLLPILVISYQSYHCSRQAVTELQESSLNAQLDAKEKQIQNWLDERRKDLHSLADTSYVLNCNHISKNPGCRLFHVISSREDTYEGLYLYDPDWKLLQKQTKHEHPDMDLLTSKEKSGIEKSDDLFFTSAHSHSDGTLRIHVGCRLTRNGEIQGFAFAVMNATHAVSSLLADKDSAYYHLIIIDDKGEDILHPGSTNTERALPQAILNGTRRLQFYENNTGEDVVGVSKTIPSLNWTLMLEAQKADTFRWVDTLRKRSLVTAVLLFLVTGIMACILSRSITTPFKLLSATARRISSGNVDLRAYFGFTKESQDVALAFNEMLDSLERLRIEISQQTALAAIGQLSSSVVHEMRNPLSSIRLNLQALRRKVEGDAIHSELADIAQGQTDRLEHLLNELLLFGKPMVLKKEPVSFHELIKWIRQDATPILNNRDICLDITAVKEPVLLNVDMDKVRQIFINLIENAVHACHGRGNIQISSSKGERFFKIVVKDSGEGIPETILSEMFQPFITGRSSGTGLGLANVKRIVELHGGTVSAQNGEAGGAEFIITFPCSGEGNTV